MFSAASGGWRGERGEGQRDGGKRAGRVVGLVEGGGSRWRWAGMGREVAEMEEGARDKC